MSQARTTLLAATLSLTLPLAALAQTATTPATPPAAEAKPADAKPAEAKPAEAAKKTGVTVTPYGFVLANLFWDSDTFNVRDYPGQAAYNQAAGGAFIGSARQSRFGVRLAVNDENWAKAALTGVIEFDFNGGHAPTVTNSTGWYNGLVRLRLAAATATWKVPTGTVALLAGQEYGLVDPLFATSLAWTASPLFWQAGNVWRRSPQVRATYNGTYGTLGVNFAAAVLSPADANSGDLTTGTAIDNGTGNQSRRPDMEARLAFALKPSPTVNGTVGVSYHQGYRRFTDDRLKGEHALGVDLDANLPYLNVRGEYYRGEGSDDTYFGIVSPGVSNNAAHVAVQTDGYWAQAVLKPTDIVWIHGGYGKESADKGDLRAGGYTAVATGTTAPVRNENEQIEAGVIVNVGKAWKVGVEGLKTTTTYLDGQDRDAMQIAFSSQLIF